MTAGDKSPVVTMSSLLKSLEDVDEKLAESLVDEDDLDVSAENNVNIADVADVAVSN